MAIRFGFSRISYLTRLDQLNELEAANGGAQEKLLQFFYQISL